MALQARSWVKGFCGDCVVKGFCVGLYSLVLDKKLANGLSILISAFRWAQPSPHIVTNIIQTWSRRVVNVGRVGQLCMWWQGHVGNVELKLPKIRLVQY